MLLLKKPRLKRIFRGFEYRKTRHKLIPSILKNLNFPSDNFKQKNSAVYFFVIYLKHLTQNMKWQLLKYTQLIKKFM